MNADEKKILSQEKIHTILFNREVAWQEIIYDLINTQELDPWDVDIILLTNKYLEKIKELEEMDFFISSKVLLAASLLLKIKSDALLNKFIKSIDEILFPKEVKQKESLQKFDFDIDIPELILKSPIPRFKKISLRELMWSLEKAINTENRRIKKEILNRNALREVNYRLPKKRAGIRSRIKDIYDRILSKMRDDKSHKISFHEFFGNSKEEKIFSFHPLLHLESQKKIWLDQKEHFEDIHIWLKKSYFKENGNPIKRLNQEIEKDIQELKKAKIEKTKLSKKEKEKRLKKINKEFVNPLGTLFN